MKNIDRVVDLLEFLALVGGAWLIVLVIALLWKFV